MYHRLAPAVLAAAALAFSISVAAAPFVSPDAAAAAHPLNHPPDGQFARHIIAETDADGDVLSPPPGIVHRGLDDDGVAKRDYLGDVIKQDQQRQERERLSEGRRGVKGLLTSIKNTFLPS